MYKICIVNYGANGNVELKETEHSFDSRGSAESFINNADDYDYGGLRLTILQVWEP